MKWFSVQNSNNFSSAFSIVKFCKILHRAFQLTNELFHKYSSVERVCFNRRNRKWSMNKWMEFFQELLKYQLLTSDIYSSHLFCLVVLIRWYSFIGCNTKISDYKCAFYLSNEIFTSGCREEFVELTMNQEPQQISRSETIISVYFSHSTIHCLLLLSVRTIKWIM